MSYFESDALSHDVITFSSRIYYNILLILFRYYTRLASMARHIYVRSPVGVSTMTKIYGGKHDVLIYPQLYLDAVWSKSPIDTGIHFKLPLCLLLPHGQASCCLCK